MKRAAASTLTLVLLSVIVICPLLICPWAAYSRTAPDSCCHQSQKAPCRSQAIPDCPYSILEKSTAAPDIAAQLSLPAVTAAVRPAVPVLRFAGAVETGGRLIDSERLFLRNRVLLV